MIKSRSKEKKPSYKESAGFYVVYGFCQLVAGIDRLVRNFKPSPRLLTSQRTYQPA